MVRADEPKSPSPASSGATRPDEKQSGSGPSIAERFAKIRAEYENQLTVVRKAVANAPNPGERNEIYDKLKPNEADYSRRMVDLAESSPADSASRDALIWVISKGFMPDEGAYGDEFARASALLIRHHGDDPEAVRIGMGLSNVLSFHRDALLLGFYASAKGQEAKGLARLALAKYLERKSRFVVGARKMQGRPKRRFRTVDADGNPVSKEIELPDEVYAYRVHLLQYDSEALHAEAERLYEEVITDYGDVPMITGNQRRLETLLKEPEPRRNGEPLTAEQRREIEKVLSRRQTLGEVAQARLDEIYNLTVGKPAPEIDGVGMNGKPLKLSDYRGRVVVVVFWGSWCGPCMLEVPHERKLVVRLRGQPFTLLGVNCEDDQGTARKVMEREGMSWPNWHDGAPGEGPIAKRYHIHGYPSIFVLDAKGIIRARQARGEALDQVVDDLLKEMNQATPPQGTRQLDSKKGGTPE
jgi:thiol-disulfide isomerase/thioredoxin